MKKINIYFFIIILFANSWFLSQTKASFIDPDITIPTTSTDIPITKTVTNLINTKTTPKRIYKIKVLLDEQNSETQKIFSIKSSKDLAIQNIPENILQIFLKDKTLQIMSCDNNLYLISNGIRYKIKNKELIIKPTSNRFSFNNKTFKGELKFKIDEIKKSLFIINTVNLENYIYSVLRYESYPSWPKDMQKIQAIASRSYAIACIKQARSKRNKDPFDIKRSNFHQTYNGTHQSKHLKEAVMETKGVILTYNNDPILAMFDACCGGILTANMKNPNFQKAPYLARQKRCTFCSNYNLYRWRKELSIEAFINKLKNNKLEQKINALGKIQDIGVVERDSAGIVHKVKLIGNKKSIILSGKDLWENLKEYIKSLSFNIKKINNKIVINGNGFGHQIGLCQRGARELLRKGWNFKNVLRFYYPNIKFARLKYA